MECQIDDMRPHDDTRWMAKNSDETVLKVVPRADAVLVVEPVTVVVPELPSPLLLCSDALALMLAEPAVVSDAGADLPLVVGDAPVPVAAVAD